MAKSRKNLVPSITAAAEPGGRFYLRELDGLRFFAFAGVFVHHLLSPHLFNSPTSGRLQPLQRVVRYVAVNGWVGVDLFFVLSAFLITELLLREQERFGGIALRSFWTRRILRIWPLYYLAIVLGFVVLPRIPALGIESGAGPAAIHDLWHHHFLPFLLLAGNWSTVAYGFAPSPIVSVLWSVSVEEQFYLFWPLVICWTTRASLLRVLPALLIATIAVRFTLALDGVVHPGIYCDTFARLDPIVLGAGLSLAWRAPKIRAKLMSWRVVWLPLAVVLFVLVSLGPSPLTDSVNITWQFFLNGLACTALVLATISGGMVQKIARFAAFVWLGRISYGLYVYHRLGIGMAELAIERLFHPDTIGMDPLALDSLRFVTALGVTTMLATISYYGFERYFLRAKSRFTRVASRPLA